MTVTLIFHFLHYFPPPKSKKIYFWLLLKYTSMSTLTVSPEGSSFPFGLSTWGAVGQEMGGEVLFASRVASYLPNPETLTH